MIVVFGLMGLVALIGVFYNPWQLATVSISAMLVIAGIKDLKN